MMGENVMSYTEREAEFERVLKAHEYEPLFNAADGAPLINVDTLKKQDKIKWEEIEEHVKAYEKALAGTDSLIEICKVMKDLQGLDESGEKPYQMCLDARDRFVSAQEKFYPLIREYKALHEGLRASISKLEEVCSTDAAEDVINAVEAEMKADMVRLQGGTNRMVDLILDSYPPSVHKEMVGWARKLHDHIWSKWQHLIVLLYRNVHDPGSPSTSNSCSGSGSSTEVRGRESGSSTEAIGRGRGQSRPRRR